MSRKRQIWNDAKRIVKENSRLSEVVQNAGEKMRKISKNSGQLQNVSLKVNVLIRMVKSLVSRDYVAFSNRTVLLVVFALLYFVIPTDVIPDFIPALGLTDDISLIYFIWQKVEEDISAFLAWEQAK